MDYNVFIFWLEDFFQISIGRFGEIFISSVFFEVVNKKFFCIVVKKSDNDYENNFLVVGQMNDIRYSEYFSVYVGVKDIEKCLC